MLLGEWWVANPTEGAETYEPPDRADRVPGTLREDTPGEFVLETIGFLGDRPLMLGGSDASGEGSAPDIWGTDRDANCYSLIDNFQTHSSQMFGHVSDGHEDWSVGWLTKGKAWATSETECDSVRIQVDDLHAWTQYRRSGHIELDDDRHAARVDLRPEAIGSKEVGGATVSLVRNSY